jgi:ribosomal protein L23
MVPHVANTEKSNTNAESVLDLLFVDMVKEKKTVKRVVERLYVKHHCAKLELVKIAKVYVLAVSFIRTQTNQTRATTRPRNAPWSILC